MLYWLTAECQTPGLPIYAQDINAIKENWKILIDKGVTTVFPGHGKPFPVEIMKRKLNYPVTN